MRGVNTCCCLGAFIGLAMVGALFGIFTIKKSEITVLKQIHVLFAHGGRTPSMEEIQMYPMNQYQRETYFPHGYNSLTNDGKMTVFKSGEKLRELYGEFVGDVYRHTEAYMRAMDTDLSKMSALLFLAGFWPVERHQMWTDLAWQPIPYRNPAFDKDHMLFEHNCPRYKQEKEQATELFLEKSPINYHDVFQRLTIFTGHNVTNPHEVLRLANLLNIQESMNMESPEWFKNMRETIADIVKLEYNLMFHNPLMRRLSAGTLIERMIYDSKIAIENDKKNKDNVKMYAYSGSITNVASILAAVEKKISNPPDYGAIFVLELHYKPALNNYLVKLVYFENDFEESRILELTPGKQLINIEDAEILLRDVLKIDYEIECKTK